VIGDDAPVPVKLPGEDVTVKEVMAERPVKVGAVKVTDADELPAVAVPIVGASGLVGPELEATPKIGIRQYLQSQEMY
jgi:hypothetical protein